MKDDFTHLNLQAYVDPFDLLKLVSFKPKKIRTIRVQMRGFKSDLIHRQDQTKNAAERNTQ